ncbi:DoxX family protein, partial [Pradoshia sp.]
MEDMGILIVRLVVGGLFLAHGAQKLFGWFRGAGLVGTAGWFESIDIKPGFFMALMVGIIEFIGGLFL